MKKIKFFLLSVALAGLISCKNSTSTYKDITEAAGNGVIYFGGDILTMAGDTPNYAEAVWIKDGKIAYVGSLEQAKKQAPDAKLADLEGKTLMPSFIDAHSHYINSLTVSHQANVSPKPITDGNGNDTADKIAETIKEFKDKGNFPKDSLIQAYGYDDTKITDGKLLNRDILDEKFPDNPVVVGHISMHGAVLNSKALERFHITKDTPTPKGGVIVRDSMNAPYGLIMETAYLPIFDNLPKPNKDQEVDWSRAGQKLYAEAGITTAHDGATKFNDLQVMKNPKIKNIIDIVAFPFITDVKAILANYPLKDWKKYDNHLKIGGIKITIDGSPQGKTACFNDPYLTGSPSNKDDKNWRGEPTFSQGELNAMVAMVYGMNVPLNLHANGDAAIDAFLKAHETVAKHDLGKERNITMIHSQFVRNDQLQKYPKYKILPSFYTLHTYYFADAHVANRGQKQAEYMSPMKDAIGLGLKPTNHTDFIVLPLNQMMVLWSSVNRIPYGKDKPIGPDQRITPYQGLQALTIHPAIQYMEDKSKGTLELNKLADLVILDKNPLKEDPMKIKDIKVLQTIKEGKVIYDKNKA